MCDAYKGLYHEYHLMWKFSFQASKVMTKKAINTRSMLIMTANYDFLQKLCTDKEKSNRYEPYQYL